MLVSPLQIAFRVVDHVQASQGHMLSVSMFI